MVGVPRSKGCRICVQRRVKCDGAVPKCKNCLKGNRPCPGYDTSVKFQDETLRLKQKYGTRPLNMIIEAENAFELPILSKSPESDSSTAPDTPDFDSNSGTLFPLAMNEEDALELPSFNVAKSAIIGFLEGNVEVPFNFDATLNGYIVRPFATSFSSEVAFFPSDPNSMIDIPLYSPSVVQEQLLVEFANSISPPSQGFLPDELKNASKWLRKLPDLSGTDQLLDSAIRAVTLVHIGRLHNVTVFVNESRPYYGKALRLLNIALTDESTGTSNTTLCATILLSFYEMFASNDNASWIRHAGGAGMLMRMRGAERHRTGYDRDLFLAYRHTLLIEAFQHDRPSFLDEPEWRKLSRDIHDDTRSSKTIPESKLRIVECAELFYRELASITVTTSQCRWLDDRARREGLDKPHETMRLYRKLIKHHDVLSKLFSEFNFTLNKLDAMPTLHDVDDPIISSNYHFVNVFVSSFYAGYFTTLTIVNLYLSGIGSSLVREGVIQDNLAIYLNENRHVSFETCRCVNYMLGSSFLGPFFAVFALRLASQVFYGQPEWDWVVAKLWEIGERRMSMAKHLPWFEETGLDVEEVRRAVGRVKPQWRK